MKNNQIASQVVPAALRAANQAEGSPLKTKTLIQLSAAVSSAVSAHGYRNQKAIARTVLRAVPEFQQIAKVFFQLMREIPVIAHVSCSKDYEAISQFIIKNRELTPKQRLKCYEEQYASRKAKCIKICRSICRYITIICTAANICLYVFIPENRQKLLRTGEKLKKHLERIKKYIRLSAKTLKLIIHQLIK